MTEREEINDFNGNLFEFLNRAVTPFHAVAVLTDQLVSEGFEELDERDSWNLVQGGKYFVVRGGGSIAAFQIGSKSPTHCGFRMLGAIFINVINSFGYTFYNFYGKNRRQVLCFPIFLSSSLYASDKMLRLFAAPQLNVMIYISLTKPWQNCTSN